LGKTTISLYAKERVTSPACYEYRGSSIEICFPDCEVLRHIPENSFGVLKFDETLRGEIISGKISRLTQVLRLPPLDISRRIS
jgi:hypothetical protein